MESYNEGQTETILWKDNCCPDSNDSDCWCIGCDHYRRRALLKAFGFEYDSTKAWIRFFLMYYIISLPMESIAEAFAKVLKEFGRIKKDNRITGFVADVIMTCLTMSLVDYFMKSISIPEIAIFVYAMVMAAVSVYMEEKETDKEGSKN